MPNQMSVEERLKRLQQNRQLIGSAPDNINPVPVADDSVALRLERLQQNQKIKDERAGSPGFGEQILRSDALGSIGGELIGGLGSAALLAGTSAHPLLKALSVAAASGIGAAGGVSASRAAQGKPQPSAGELAAEAGLTALPEVAGSAIRGAISGPTKQFVKRSKLGGDVIAANQREVFEREANRILQTPNRQQAKQAFELVAQGGTKVNGKVLASKFAKIPTGSAKRIRQVVENSVLTGDLEESLGSEFLSKLGVIDNALKEGAATSSVLQSQGLTFDLGELQSVRSKIQKQAFKTRDLNNQNRLYKGVNAIDQAVEEALSDTSGQVAKEALEKAREQWRRLVVADDLRSVVISASKPVDGRDAIRFNTGQLRKSLIEPKNPSLLNNLEKVQPGSSKELLEWVKKIEENLPDVTIEGGALREPGKVLSNLPIDAIETLPFMTQGVGALGDLIANTAGRNFVENLLIKQHGRITVPQIMTGLAATGFNAQRRESGETPIPNFTGLRGTP